MVAKTIGPLLTCIGPLFLERLDSPLAHSIRRTKNAWDYSSYLDSFLVTWVCFFVHDGRIHPHSIGRRDRSNPNSCHSGSKTLVATFKRFLPSSPSFLLLVVSSRLIQLKKPSFSRLQSNSPGGHIHGGRNSTTDFTGLSPQIRWKEKSIQS